MPPVGQRVKLKCETYVRGPMCLDMQRCASKSAGRDHADLHCAFGRSAFCGVLRMSGKPTPSHITQFCPQYHSSPVKGGMRNKFIVEFIKYHRTSSNTTRTSSKTTGKQPASNEKVGSERAIPEATPHLTGYEPSGPIYRKPSETND
jgi:hypothetical protein